MIGEFYANGSRAWEEERPGYRRLRKVKASKNQKREEQRYYWGGASVPI